MYPDDRALLMVGESYNTADMYYVTRFLIGDPAVYVDRGDGDSLFVCTDFERDVAATQARATRVRGFKEYGNEEVREQFPKHMRTAELTLRAVRGEGVTRAVTTDNMPLSIADYLRANGIDLLCDSELISSKRELKDADELAAIEHAQRATERAALAAIDLVAGSHVGADGILISGGLPLTSERLRARILASLLEDDCTGEGTIAASGPDSAQPHNRGAGPVRAGQPIIFDIFPRHNAYRYYADMTRTVSKGAPDSEIVRMYDTTNRALDLALSLIKPGVTGKSVNDAVCQLYEEHGYQTYLRGGKMPDSGFIHSLGHGVGLEIHEGPTLSRDENVLRAGEVITVEPGLYIPGFGGVRIEDMIVVTEDGCRNMTDFPKTLVV